ncbi:uncharacterized protein LOC110657160 isoform X2 [Hevea brasiliensis]|uniref:uncharacterized protein LOC110657160 isoform X2 n=1 Tax=Hevea brasiliensis TaxID=3981 RepID=UPI0025D7B937|nr:uncharacterized protein LOC110657160 isoform X2 [Hevea brasiliensis]
MTNYGRSHGFLSSANGSPHVLCNQTFCLCKLVFKFALKTMFIVIHTWVELLISSISFHLNLFHKIIIWMISLISLLMQIVTALKRERLLQEHLHEMQIELDSLVLDRKELQDQLHIAMKECRTLESVLAEVEEENDRVIAKIELLEGENLKVENLQLKEIRSKDHWSFKGHYDADDAPNDDTDDADGHGISYASQSCCNGSGIIFEGFMMQKDAWEGEGKREAELFKFWKTGCKARWSVHSFSHCIISRSLDINEGLGQRMDVALSQSVFSAVLSLLVGIIIWEAEDPCMPLVVALFAVLGMSLKSVVQFFSTIKNKPASDAVALLSFNCFILGTLTYPMLPRVAHIFALLTVSFWTMDWASLVRISLLAH